MSRHRDRSFAAPITAVAVLLAPVLAQAQDVRDWYATGFAGFVTQSDQKLAFAGGPVTSSPTLKNDTGFGAGGALGRRLGDQWRVEIEFSYRSVDHAPLTLFNGGPSGDGNYASTSVAVNALYDFDLFGSSRARSYVGAGIAYLTEVDVDFESAGRESSFSGSDTGFQLMAGVRYDLGSRAFVDLSLRYLMASSVELDAEENATGRITADYEPLSLMVGFGWRF
jgi:opacity protein-like surface antigen